MAFKFNNWTKAFSELQKTFGLSIVNIPDSIINDIKPEFSGTSNPINDITIPSPAKEISFTNPETSEINNSIERVEINTLEMNTSEPSTSLQK